MGFFAQHTTFNEGSGKKFVTAEAGIYVCALVDVEAVQSKSFDDPNVMEPNLKWVFETTEVGDDDGQPFRFIQYTKTSYGNDKAKLTLLLDGMVGRMTMDAYRNLDLPALKAKPWQVVVLTNVVETVKPVKVAAIKPLRKAAPMDDITDPFAGE